MKLIKTKNFELAIYAKGGENSPKVALVLPGRLDTKDYLHIKSHVDYLASRGFFALSFDPPGTWESPGEIELYTMTNYLKAVDEIIEYYGNKPTVLMGVSRGGSIAMLKGAQNQNVTHIITVMSSVSGSSIDKKRVKGDVQVEQRDTPPNDPNTKITLELPLAYFKDSAMYNILDKIKTCTKPKLFFLGKDDTMVDPDSVRAIYQIVAEPKELCELQARHDYRLQEGIIDEINKAVGNFLNKYE